MENSTTSATNDFSVQLSSRSKDFWKTFDLELRDQIQSDPTFLKIVGKKNCPQSNDEKELPAHQHSLVA